MISVASKPEFLARMWKVFRCHFANAQRPTATVPGVRGAEFSRPARLLKIGPTRWMPARFTTMGGTKAALANGAGCDTRGFACVRSLSPAGVKQ